MRGEVCNKLLLYDIVYYSGLIKKSVDRIGADYEKFIDEDNFNIRDSCAFYVGQIGELAKKLTEKFKAEHAEIPWHQIVGTRNRIVHDYKNFDMEKLWGFMLEDVPELNEKCREWLFALDPEAEADLREELAEEGILDPK